MSFIATAVIGGAVLGAYTSNKASKRAASSIAEGQASAEATHLKMFNLSREDLAPYREVGEDALNLIKRVFINGDLSGFTESADYRFNLQQGEQALQRKESAAGARYGGGSIKEGLRYAQGMASGEYGNFFDRLFKTANLGEAAAAQSAANATSTGTNLANTAIAGGNARANIAMNQGQAMNNAIQGGIGNLVTLKTYNDLASRLPPPTPTTTFV